MRRIGFAAFLCIAAVAVLSPTDADACTRRNGKLVCGDDSTPVKMSGAVTFEGPAGANDGGPSITFSGRGLLVYDFPSIPATGANSGCQSSAAGTATGCRFGDTLMMGVDQVPPTANNASMPRPYISAADSFKIQVCNDSNDGGAIDWPDASFTVRCVR